MTLMPISLIWQDFLDKHEYSIGDPEMMVNVEQLMNLVSQTNEYIGNTYNRLGVTQPQFDEIANIISPLLYSTHEENQPPHPDKEGDNPPAGVKVP